MPWKQTSALMERFYTHIAEGQDKAGATKGAGAEADKAVKATKGAAAEGESAKELTDSDEYKQADKLGIRIIRFAELVDFLKY